jgi:D-glycero-D-manno-heptose 1,7-bisphosphate phosphatase
VTNKAVFLDRDGTLNVDKGYAHRIEDWEWLPGAVDAIAALKKAGFLVIVITNQAGIARGYYSGADVTRLHAWMNEELEKYGTRIDGFYYCPHHPEHGGECECRKPRPGMLFQARQDFDIDFSRSWLIGDKASDIQASVAAGVKSILVLTGYGKDHRALLSGETVCAEDMAAASNLVISHCKTAESKRY